MAGPCHPSTHAPQLVKAAISLSRRIQILQPRSRRPARVPTRPMRRVLAHTSSHTPLATAVLLRILPFCRPLLPPAIIHPRRAQLILPPTMHIPTSIQVNNNILTPNISLRLPHSRMVFRRHKHASTLPAVTRNRNRNRTQPPRSVLPLAIRKSHPRPTGPYRADTSISLADAPRRAPLAQFRVANTVTPAYQPWST